MGHELIKKKLIIVGCILSVLCLLGLVLIFVPNWGCKKDDDVSDIGMDNPVQNVTNISTVVDNNFDFSFLKNENNKKNMVYSPISIKYDLNMLKEGAVGSTYDEINSIIGNSKLPNYSNIDKILSLANGLFIRNPYYDYIKPEYKNALKEKYDGRSNTR